MSVEKTRECIASRYPYLISAYPDGHCHICIAIDAEKERADQNFDTAQAMIKDIELSKKEQERLRKDNADLRSALLYETNKISGQYEADLSKLRAEITELKADRSTLSIDQWKLRALLGETRDRLTFFYNDHDLDLFAKIKEALEEK